MASNPRVLYISFGVSKRSEINKVHSHRASIARLQASKSIVRPTPRIRKSGWVATLSIHAKMPRGHTLTVPAAVPSRYATYGCIPTRLEREGLLRVREQERLVGDRPSAERLSQILDDLLRTVLGRGRHPPQVRLVDEGEPIVPVDRAPCRRDLRRRLLPPEMEEVDHGLEHLVGIHGMRQGSPRNESSVPIRSTFGHLAEPLYTADSSWRPRRETDTPQEREFCEGRTG